MKYKVLRKQDWNFGGYTLTPIRERDILLIRKWRNEQMDILRQDALLTERDQRIYYRNVILPSFTQKKPEQVLFSFILNGKCVGYGGLVHINWNAKEAEMSYLADPERIKNGLLYAKEFSIFINLIKQVAFAELGLRKIFTETYDIRPKHVKILEKNGFGLEKRIKNRVRINGRQTDSLIHVCLRKNRLETLKGKKVFVSGGSGVIGSELVERLHKEGAIIFVGDLKPRPKHWPGDIIYRQGDLNYITKEELESFNPEFFFHLAATFERSTETYEFWEENFWHNVRLSNHLMTFLKDSQSLKKIIFASSYLIYDPKTYIFDKQVDDARCLKEDGPIYPRNLTGSAKLNHEIELQFLANFKNKKLKVCLVRIFRSYGKGSRDIISRWIRMLIKGKRLDVYHKEGIFDFIYAGEVAEGLLKLSSVPEAGGIFNLGSGNARKIADVITILKKYFPAMRCREVNSDTAFEASQADMGCLYEVTGWKPEKQLEDAIPEIIRFEKERSRVKPAEDDFNVLVTSISRKVPMIKAIRKAGQKLGSGIKLHGGDANPSCLGSHFVDKFWKMPRLEEPLAAEKIIAYCKKNNIKAVIPSRDGELLFWARNKERLRQAGISVMVSNYASIGICLDKIKFSKTMAHHGLPAIAAEENIFDIKIRENGKYVVKERFGAGSVDAALALTKAEAVLYSKKLSTPIFQPFVTGKEYSVDAYVARDKKIKGMIIRSRDIIVKGESQITTLAEDKKKEAVSRAVIDKLNLYGHVVLQLLKDRSGKCHFIECNPRFGGASTLSVFAGLDSFYWFLLEAVGADIGAYPFIKAKNPLRQIRYPEDMVTNNNQP